MYAYIYLCVCIVLKSNLSRHLDNEISENVFPFRSKKSMFAKRFDICHVCMYFLLCIYVYSMHMDNYAKLFFILT